MALYLHERPAGNAARRQARLNQLRGLAAPRRGTHRPDDRHRDICRRWLGYGMLASWPAVVIGPMAALLVSWWLGVL